MAINPADDNASIRVLFSEEDIAERVDTLGQEIAGLLGNDLLLIAILKGSFVFTADLMRSMHRAGIRPQVDFMQLSSYGTGTESSKTVEMVRDTTDPIEGRNILIVDDILESGRTMDFAREHLYKRGANKVGLCVLLDKVGKRVEGVGVEADFVGFVCPDEFVVGYGLDWAHYYRELPFIGVVEDS
ncbi:MAG: hypoxanthine phosphoribosyltransferase [Alphaproteobacteria bacterium]|nr:hypoxanthine phosphoribosyltransferase [Alphaproteobacteria bacterium]